MPETIKEIIDKYTETTQILNAGQIKDSQKLKQLNIELNQVSELYPKALEYKKTADDIAFAKESVQETADEQESEFYNEIIVSGETRLEQILNEIKSITKQTDSNDKRNVLLEIRAGTGGEEASLFAGELYRMYAKYAEKNQWTVEQLSKSNSESGGIKEIVVFITGKGAYGRLKNESGVHRVQRIPVTESSGRIHTSSASVVALPEVQDVEVEIQENDLRIDVFRSGGAGGQSVNTTDSAIRITHLPTGIVISCQDERSQLKNKNRAIKILKSKLFDLKMHEQENQEDKMRKNYIRSGDRSEKIRTYNFPQSRITDHRIKTSWHNLPALMEGEIDSIVETLNKHL